MEKMKNSFLGLFGKIVSAVCLFAVRMAVGTMSWFGMHEPEMPNCLIPKDGE